MDLTTSGIYKITNITNQHFYIGSTKNFNNRWKQHLELLRKNKHTSPILQKAYNRYGGENLLFEIVEFCPEDEPTLLLREQYYLDTLKPNYNTNPIAGKPPNLKGRKSSARKCARQSASLKGRPGTNTGKTFPKEWRDKISMGVKASRKLKPLPIGWHHKEESKELMRFNHNPNSNISTPEKRANQSKGLRNWWNNATPEMKNERMAKMLETRKKRYGY